MSCSIEDSVTGRILGTSCLAAAFLAVAGCSAPEGRGDAASQTAAADPRGVAGEAFPFDRHVRGGDDPEGAPFASGADGTLGYTQGCLYLAQGGGRTGLVMPRDARFDGKRLTARNRDHGLGDFVHMSGMLLEKPERGRYGCNTPTLLIVDPMSARPPSDPPVHSGQEAQSMTLLTYQGSEPSAAGRLTGKLDLVGNCLVIRIGNSATEGFVPVFPEGRSRWDAEKRAVILNDHPRAVGSIVDFGGGSHNRNATDVAIRGERSRDCPDFNYWLVPLNN
ncbi:MAG TPA: hypothetical protein VEZ70_11320 [Allosphingosinicella sp.]|nr:hypothetical protein [Allosphingosinicella sp.]